MSVKFDVAASITTITLDRSQRANAYDGETLDALGAAFVAVETAVVVIRSAGAGAFCAGADRDALAAASPLDALDLKAQRVFDVLARAPWISVAAVHGAAVGGGFELALACDLRVAGPAARFWLPETGIGLVPAAGGCTRLPRLVGRSRAKAVILGGRRLSAEDALDWGLVDRIADDPRAAAAAWAAEVAQRDPLALRLAKQILDTDQSSEASLQQERLTETILYAQRPGRE